MPKMPKMPTDRKAIEPFVQVPYSMVTDKNLSGEALKLFCIIARNVYFMPSGKCKMTNAHFTAILGKADRTISRYLEELEEHGYVTSNIPRKADNGVWKTARTLSINYRFMPLYRPKPKN